MAEEGSSQQRAQHPPPPLPPTMARRSIRAVDSLHGLPPFGVSYFPGTARYIAGTACAPLPFVTHSAGAGNVGAQSNSSLPLPLQSPNDEHCDMASHNIEDNIKKSVEESHVCNICSKSYTSSRGLGRHASVHNKATSAPQAKGSKRSHAETKSRAGSSSVPEDNSRNASSPSTGKRYICNICGKSYSSRHAIGGHVAGHKKGLQTAPGKRAKSKSDGTNIVPDVCDSPKDFAVPGTPCPNEILSGAAGDVAGSSGRAVSTSDDQLYERSRSLSPGNDESGCEEPVSKKGKETEH